MRARSTLCLLALFGGAAARDAQAQTIGPRPSALFIEGRSAVAHPAADTVRAERDVVTPILVGGLGGALVSVLLAPDSDGPPSHRMGLCMVIGAGVGLLYGIFGPTSPE